jgi:hypothetical protein
MNGLVMSDTTLVQQAKKASFLPPAKGVLQRKCACGNKTITSGECEACGTKRKNLQRREVDNRSEVSEIPSIVHDVLRSSGRPLDAETRAFMEPRLGHDFSGVRVHTDAKASESAQAVNALAYTVGRNVVFRTGQFTPESVAGKHLLAHELAHTIQQQLSSGYATSALMIAEPGSSLENEADRAADATVSQSVASVKASAENITLHRQLYSGPNVGPPVSELPKPPMASCGMDKKGDWVCKGENLPGIGSTPEVPLDPRKIPDKIREALDPNSSTRKGLADCSGFPGFTAGGSSEFEGQCCKGNESNKNCCPPTRISYKEPFPRCCNMNEDLRNGFCVKKMESGEPELTVPSPEPLPMQDGLERTLPEGEEYV